MNKSRRMRWAGYVVHMHRGRGEVYRPTEVGEGNLRERDHLEDPGLDGRIILRWILRKWDMQACNGTIWPRIGTSGCI
jgi:hypothetical protein